MTHPPAIDLEALALGESPRGVAEHVATCDACSAYIARVRGVVARSADVPADTVVEDLAAAPRGDVLVRIEASRRRERNRRATLIASIAIPLVAAALLLVWMRAPAEHPHLAEVTAPAVLPGASTAAPSQRPPDRILMARAEPAEPDTTFKGGIAVAAVRDRHGEQKRFTGTVRVRSGDRLRVEVALDRTQAILAAVVGDDGSYLELMAEAARDAGTHFSERSARVDAEPIRGTILVGRPEDVQRARATGVLSGVTTLRVDVEEP